MSKTFKIESYPVRVTYFKRGVDPTAGTLTEIETTATVNVCRLSRTSVEHTKFGLSLMSGANDPEQMAETARRFVLMTIDNEPVVKDLQEDLVACMALFQSKEVQEDLKRFFSTWGAIAEKA